MMNHDRVQFQRKIFEKLFSLVGPGPAVFYRDARQLIENFDQVESRSHLVAHLVREIESALRDVLKPINLDKKKDKRKKKKVAQIHKNEINEILKVFNFPEIDDIRKKWFEFEETKHIKAHRNALDKPRLVDSEFLDWFVQFENLLSSLLDGLQKQISVVFNKIDTLLQNSNINAKALKNMIPNNLMIMTYFFRKCENPAWLSTLKKNGFFSSPPQPERNEIDGSFKFMPWPQSLFLSRMATQRPEQVMNIISKIPTNGNILVYEDLADAALRMPTEIAVKLLDKVKLWMETSPVYSLLPYKIGDLIVYYAEGGQIDASFDLAGLLFNIFPDSTEYDKNDDKGSLPPEPRIRCDVWDFTENLKKCMPSLLETDGARAFQFICDLLNKTVGYASREGEKSAPHDASAMWRPAIEDHEQNGPFDLMDSLVNEVRDTAIKLCEKNPVQIKDIIRSLENQHWKVFHRIALHVIRIFSKEIPDIVSARLSSWDMFDDEWISHEYLKLLEECFNNLPHEVQTTILGWIDKGPNIEEYKNGVTKTTGRLPTEDEISNRQKKWQLDKLSIIKDGLASEKLKEYEKLVEELGQPDHPDFPIYFTSGAGFKSPKTAQEIHQMPVSELVTFLRDWMPQTEPPFEPSPAGLGRTLSPVVAESPGKYAYAALDFRGLAPTYVRSLVSGLNDAVDKSRSFNWEPVLELCLWVLDQPDDASYFQPRKTLDADPDWKETRGVIAHLLSNGFKEGAATIPLDLRRISWSIIKPLTNDPEPTPEYEEKFGSPDLDYATKSINMTRGEAIHAVIHYALWVRRYLEKQPDANERISRGFDEMPEVREVLEYHLETSKDTSLAVRAVYGWWLPLLVLLDKEWTTKNISRIFPLEVEKSQFFFAAWDTFLTRNRAYDDVFEVVKDLYVHYVNNLGMDRPKKSGIDPDEKLAHHLMTLYWRGKISLDEPGGILAVFWKMASPQLRGQAIGFIGHWVQETNENLSDELRQRFIALWSFRLEEAKNSPSKDDYKQEMGAFVFWFITDHFEEEWQLEQLTEALRIEDRLQIKTFVMAKLIKLMDAYPQKVIECVSIIAKGGSNLFGITDDFMSILTKALENKETSDVAMDIVNLLLSRGNFEFKRLLEEQGKKDKYT